MARKRGGAPTPTSYEPEAMRGNEAFLPARERIPGIHQDLVGGYRERSPDKDDTTLQGHPEAAGIYCGGYDNSSPHLEATPYRMDRNYVSPETIRRGSRSPFGGR